MEKKKINIKSYTDTHSEKTIKCDDGTEITVRDHIPYTQKEYMANELLEDSTVIHDDSCVYTSIEADKNKLYLVAKYYTDIDTDGEDPIDVADFMINTGIAGQIMEYIRNDFDYVIDIFYNLYDAIDIVYKDDTSISKALRKSFGFLFNGEDVTESLAKAEAMKDTVYEAINAFRKVEKEKAENLDNGTMTIAGNIINFAKKKE